MPNVVTPATLARPIPLLLDTDIGTDIDDVYALIIAAVSPEFDLRAVSVVNNDVGLRARIARRVLDLLGTTGCSGQRGGGSESDTGRDARMDGTRRKGIDLSATPAPPCTPRRIHRLSQVHRRALRSPCLRRGRCAKAGTPLTVCPIGAMTNLALALREYPEQTQRIGQVIAMAADFRGYGRQCAQGTQHRLRSRRR